MTRAIVLLTLALAFATSPAAAQTPPAPAPQQAAPAAQQNGPSPQQRLEDAARQIGVDFGATIGAWTTTLERVENLISREPIRNSELDKFRDQLEGVKRAIEAFTGQIRPRLADSNAQVEKMGPPPKADQPPEAEPVAKTRAELTGQRDALDSALRTADALWTRASQNTAKIQDIRRRKFTERLFERSPNVLSPTTWADAPGHIVASTQKSWSIVGDWWSALEYRADVVQLALIALGIMVALLVAGFRGVAHFRRWPGEDPPFWRRTASAAWVILLRSAPLIAPVLFFYHSMVALEVMSQPIERLLYSGSRMVVIITAVTALITTVLAPGQPRWRIFPASEGAALRIRWLVIALASVYSVNLFIGTITRVGTAPFAVTLTQTFISSIVFALLVIAILRTRLDPPDIDGAPQLNWLGALRVPMWGIAILILFTALTGYVPMARFISAQLILTGSLLVIVYLLLVWADAFGQAMGDENALTGGWMKRTFGFDQRRREQLALPITLFLKFVVLLLAVPLIMLQWGFNWKDVLDWLRNLFFGFQVGNTQISIAAILASLIVFIVGYFASKLFQSWLDRQVLKPSGMSGGARDSIKTGVGYLGVFTAGVFAFSYAGLDLSNLAIIAGAFSVGIGFGLQSVISNFVSGLILLAERPIKVGDWVVVGGEEGHVRRISVRSTEIETFDKANVIVPNSYFITETVKNWTLHNNTGRIIIPVGVDYSSDPAKVKDVLLQVARANGHVMTDPAPFVYFEDFGSDALNFKLYAFVYNINSSLGVRTDLRIAIMKAFREAGIEMPYRQTDIHMKGMEWLKDAITAYVDTATAASAAGNGAARPGNGRKEPQ
ncbi:MAG: mechanosensitive ion channel family protein [Chitinophagales bacterium]|nr:mechanosensitive ion channel family protein [Hyphomicrobiales bacterium]